MSSKHGEAIWDVEMSVSCMDLARPKTYRLRNISCGQT